MFLASNLCIKFNKIHLKTKESAVNWTEDAEPGGGCILAFRKSLATAVKERGVLCL